LRELAFFEDLTLVIDFEEVTLKVEMSAVLPMMKYHGKMKLGFYPRTSYPVLVVFVG